jgi:serine O-acetyltransferase
VANALLHAPLAQYTAAEANMQAAIISNRGKLLSGAEIHHRCTIGRRFILDHGIGAVIGETTHIGDDCYVLGGVVLGATGISGNPFGKRHPTLGNRVQVGSFSSIFGPVSIGDDVFIGPHCVIKDDVPANAIVTLKSELQVVRSYSQPKKKAAASAVVGSVPAQAAVR